MLNILVRSATCSRARSASNDKLAACCFKKFVYFKFEVNKCSSNCTTLAYCQQRQTTRQVYRKKHKRQETSSNVHHHCHHSESSSLLRGFEKNIIFEGTQQIPLHHHNIESILMASKHLRRFSIAMEDLFTPEEHASLQAMVNVDGSYPKRDNSVQVGQKYA